MKQTSTFNLFSWALYDWANSSFSAIIQTFVFAAYFTQKVASDPETGSTQWGLVNGIAALIVAVAGPLLGAIADQGKRRKSWIIIFTYLCIIATVLLWWVTPNDKNIILASFLVTMGIIGAELSFVFYNAMLPGLTREDNIGKWSGWGWSLGYFGGVTSLIICLYGFVGPINPWFTFDRESAEHIRATFPFVALWFFLFSLPLFLWTPDTSGKGKPLRLAMKDGTKELATTLSHIRQYGGIVRFLIARMFYIDGLTTLFIFGGVYAAATFGMNENEILKFGIGLNITSGIGAGIFSWVDDRIGSRKLILLSLIGLLAPSTALLIINDSTTFWILGLFLGIFVGPVQSASRSYMARVAPPHLRNEMFGFFAFSGKATAFLGPLLVAYLIHLTGSQTVGLSVVAGFFSLGFLLMLTVPDPPLKES